MKQNLPDDIIENIAINAETHQDYLVLCSLNKRLRTRLNSPSTFKEYLLAYFNEMDFVIRFMSTRLQVPLIYETYHTMLSIPRYMQLKQFDQIMLHDYIRNERYNDGRIEFLFALERHNKRDPVIVQKLFEILFHEALARNQLSIVKTLVEEKYFGFESLRDHWIHSINDRNCEVFEYLLNKGAKVAGDPTVSVIVMLDNDMSALAPRRLLQYYSENLDAPEYQQTIESVWTVAANSGKQNAVRMLMDDFEIPPQTNGCVALFLAVRNSDLQLLRLLFEYGLQISDFHDEAPFYTLIAVTDSAEIVEVLIEYGADVNEERSMPLRYAIREGKFDIMNMLLSKGANVTNEAWNDAIGVAQTHPDVYRVIRESVVNELNSAVL